MMTKFNELSDMDGKERVGENSLNKLYCSGHLFQRCRDCPSCRPSKKNTLCPSYHPVTIFGEIDYDRYYCVKEIDRYLGIYFNEEVEDDKVD